MTRDISLLIHQARKAGQPDQALSLATAHHEDKQSPVSAELLGWVLYDQLKLQPETLPIDERLDLLFELPVHWDTAQALARSLSWLIVKVGNQLLRISHDPLPVIVLLDKCMKLSLEPVDQYCPRAALLGLALRIGTSWDRMDDFLAWWDLSLLQPEDYQPSRSKDGKKTFMALAERVYILRSKRCLHTYVDESQVREVIYELEEVLISYPQYSYLLWYLAKLRMSIGEANQARKALMPFLLKNPREFWVWQLLAETWLDTDPDKSLAAYCQAITCQRDDAFLVRLREGLVALLVRMGNLPEARHELDLLVSTRQTRGWRLPPRVLTWINQEDLTRQTAVPLPYQQLAAPLRRAILPESGTESTMAIISQRQEQKKWLFWYSSDSINGIMPMNLISEPVQEGEYIELEYRKSGDKLTVVSACLTSEGPPELKKVVKCEVDTVHDQYAFAQGIFIPKSYLEVLRKGQKYEITAVKSWQPHKKQAGWRAISVIPI